MHTLLLVRAALHTPTPLYFACIRRHGSGEIAPAEIRDRKGHRNMGELITTARMERVRCIAACRD